MTSLAARVSMIEVVVSRLADRRGDKVSELMRRARARAMAGDATPPILRDVEELERQARGTGVIAAMAKANLRMIRGFASDALLAGAEAAYSGQDAHGEAEGHPSAPHEPRCSVPPIPTLAGPSDRDLLLQRIDAVLAQANGHA